MEKQHLANVQKNGLALELVPVEERTAIICQAAVKQNAAAIEFVPEKEQTPELCVLAVKKDMDVLRLILEKKRHEDVYVAILQQNGLKLEFVPQAMRTPKVYETAIKQNALALEFIPVEERDLKICLEAVRQNPQALRFVPEHLKAEVINTITVAAIIANDYFAIQYFPTKPNFKADIKQALASIKYIVMSSPNTDAEVHDTHSLYAEKKKYVVSIREGSSKEKLSILLTELKSAENSQSLQLTLIGHSCADDEKKNIHKNDLAGLQVGEMVSVCEQNPNIKKLKLLGCHTAKAKKTKEELDMQKSFLARMEQKDKHKFGLVSTFKAPKDDKEFQQKCLVFCKNNDLQGIYVLNKIYVLNAVDNSISYHYQLFVMKYDKASESITEKVNDVRRPEKITNILEGGKPINFPSSSNLLPIRGKDHSLTWKEIAALKDIAYDVNRFERAHPKYKKDKKTYSFLGKRHAKISDLKPSLLKRLADGLKKSSIITWNVTVEGVVKIFHVDMMHHEFLITNGFSYKHSYKTLLFSYPEEILDYDISRKDHQKELQTMRSDTKSDPFSSAEQLTVLVSKSSL